MGVPLWPGLPGAAPGGSSRYWRSEQRTLRQGFVALLVSTLAALVAGVATASILPTLKLLPSLYILLPAATGMRGTIFGAIGARFGTNSAAGVFEITRERTGIVYQNVYVGGRHDAVVLAVARGSGDASRPPLFGLRSISFLQFVTISVVGGVLGSAMILGLTRRPHRSCRPGADTTSTPCRPRSSPPSATWSRSRPCSWPRSSPAYPP